MNQESKKSTSAAVAEMETLSREYIEQLKTERDTAREQRAKLAQERTNLYTQITKLEDEKVKLTIEIERQKLERKEQAQDFELAFRLLRKEYDRIKEDLRSIGLTRDETIQELRRKNQQLRSERHDLKVELEHKSAALQVLQDETSNYIKDTDQKIKDLEAWKAAQIETTPNFQEIGELLEITIGQPVHDKIVPGIQKLKAQLKTVRDDRQYILNHLKRLAENRGASVAVSTKDLISGTIDDIDSMRNRIKEQDAQLQYHMNPIQQLADRLSIPGAKTPAVVAKAFEVIDARDKEIGKWQRWGDYAHQQYREATGKDIPMEQAAG